MGKESIGNVFVKVNDILVKCVSINVLYIENTSILILNY